MCQVSEKYILITFTDGPYHFAKIFVMVILFNELVVEIYNGCNLLIKSQHFGFGFIDYAESFHKAISNIQNCVVDIKSRMTATMRKSWYHKIKIEAIHISVSSTMIIPGDIFSSTLSSRSFRNIGRNGGEITYRFSNSTCCTVYVWERISNFIPHFIMDTITYSCWDHN